MVESGQQQAAICVSDRVLLLPIDSLLGNSITRRLDMAQPGPPPCPTISRRGELLERRDAAFDWLTAPTLLSPIT